MNPIERKRNVFNRAFFYRVAIFICVVGLIVYFMPREAKFSYQFDLNKPWRYDQLIATFDFPIYKPEAMVKHEKDSIAASFQPYYELDQEVGNTAIQQLRRDSRTAAGRELITPDYFSHLRKLLEQIYAAGVISNETLNKLQSDSTEGITIIKGKAAHPTPIREVYSTKQAYTRLLLADTLHFDPNVLRSCSLDKYITPNLNYDEDKSELALEQMFDNYSWAMGLVQNGERIVEKGEIVTAEKYAILKSLHRELDKRSETIGDVLFMATGQTIFVGILVAFFILYLKSFRRNFFMQRNSIILTFSLMLIFCLATSLLEDQQLLSVYVLPYAMMPIILRTFLDSRTATTAFTITILICSITLHHPHEFILVQLSGGFMAIYSLRELTQRSQIFHTVFMVIATYLTVYLAYNLFTEYSLGRLNVSTYIYLAISGVLSLFTYPLLLLIERVFGFVSNVTLIELSNANVPLLRQLSELAPGTFQHAIQVGNLAAEAAIRIRANSQLVRTGALYHDIGKMANPTFFTENQTGGVNPHENLSPEQSAHIVIDHVIHGLQLASEHNLPQNIKNFIATHHGLGTTKYFYISWKNAHPGEEPPAGLFNYPGPNPSTKEQAILMMADAVEAASRSLPSYSEESIGELVERIVSAQVADGFFKNCPITFRQIEEVKEVFRNKLVSAYHPRISYPELKK